MKKNNFLQKGLSSILCCSLVISSMIPSVLGVYNFPTLNISKQETTQVGREASVTTVSCNDSAGNPQKFFISEYTPSTKVSPVALYGSKLYGTSNILTAAKYGQGQGYNIIAGINADFFSFETGLPLGIVVCGGELKSSDAGNNAVGFNSDGSAFIGKPKLTSYITKADGTKILVDHINKRRTPYGAYLLNSDFSANTRNSSAGTDVILDPVDATKLTASCVKQFRVSEVTPTNTAIAIPEGKYVLTIDSNGPIDRLNGINAGDFVTLEVSPSDSRFSNVMAALGGADILLKDGVIQQNLTAGTHPRSALGIKSDGSVVIFEADGRKSGYSVGLSLKDLAGYLKDMGCVSAINFDGGGSSSFIVRYPTETDIKLLNNPSDGSLRKCANFLFFVNTAVPTNIAEKLFLKPESTRVLKGVPVSVKSVAIDENYNLVSSSQKPAFTVDSSMGTVSADGVFTPSTSGKAVINAVLDNASSSCTIEVLSSVDKIVPVLQGKTTPLDSLNVKAGEKADISAIAYINNNKIFSVDKSFNYSVTESIGSIDENGVFTASKTAEGAGSITVSYGNTKAVLPVNITAPPYGLSGPHPKVVTAFEDITGWSVEPYETSVLSKNTDKKYVRFGNGSAEIAYNFSGQSSEMMMAFLAPTSPIMMGEGATSLNMWVYGDASNSILTLQVSDGGEVKSIDAGMIDFKGWKLISADISDLKNAFLSGISISGVLSSAQSGKIYLDQISITYDNVTPTDKAPYLNFKAPVSGSISGLPFTVSVFAYDGNTSALEPANVELYLDGKRINSSYSQDTKLLTAAVSSASAGLHRLTAIVTDAYGNMGRTSMDITIGKADNTELYSDMNGHWAKPYVNWLTQKGLIKGEAVGSGAFAYNPERNMSRAEFAAAISRYLDLDLNAYSDYTLNFADNANIPKWALPYVKAAVANGYISGRGAGDKVEFAPFAPITRAEAMTIIGRVFSSDYAARPLTAADADKIPSWAKDHAALLVTLKIINGYEDNTIRADKNIRRSEVAKILYNLY